MRVCVYWVRALCIGEPASARLATCLDSMCDLESVRPPACLCQCEKVLKERGGRHVRTYGSSSREDGTLVRCRLFSGTIMFSH